MEGSGEEYHWLGEEGGMGPGFGPTNRGTLRLLPGEALLETNSAERFAEAKEWISVLPGAEFETVEVKDHYQAFDEETPLDDRMNREEIEPTPELREVLNEQIRQHYLAWLDMPLPLFDGRTPREMCATEGGRKRVRREIDAIPSPSNQPGLEISIPRGEMLRELGL